MRRYLLGAMLALRLAAADETPTWLKEATAASTGVGSKGAPAVVLLDEERVTVENNGRTITTARRAVRILTREGRSAATARRVYVTATGKIKEFRAWMLPPSGREIRYGKEHILDVAVVK